MDFDAFVARAWNDHGDHPAGVAERLIAAAPTLDKASQIAPFAALVAHVLGAHLGRWQRAAQLLQALPQFETGPDPLLRHHDASLRYMDGDTTALTDLARDDRMVVWAQIAALAAGRDDFDTALRAYREALRLAEPGVADGSPALRALAVGGNNLAAALEEKADRSNEQTAGMLMAAQGGLTYWPRAGTWLQHQRAAYRLARSQLQAGQAAAARLSAELCLSICEAQRAPAFERFFGQAVLAMACRADGDLTGFDGARQAALALYATLDAEDQPWCADDLRAIDEAAP